MSRPVVLLLGPGREETRGARLAADTAALVRMSAACRGRIAEGFSAERAAEVLRALYSSVIDRHVRNRRLDRRGAQRA